MVAIRTPSMRTRQEIIDALESERSSFSAGRVMDQARLEIKSMDLVLHKIAALKPTLDTMPIDQAFRTLCEVTKLAEDACRE